MFSWGDEDEFDFGAVGGSNSPMVFHKVSSEESVDVQQAHSTPVEEDKELPLVMLNVDEQLEGVCFMRISTRTLLVRAWRPGFWHLQGYTLSLYRTKDDYIYNPRGTMAKRKANISEAHQLSDIRKKDYEGLGALYRFSLFVEGTTVAKFASPNFDEIALLYAQLKIRIEEKQDDDEEE